MIFKYSKQFLTWSLYRQKCCFRRCEPFISFFMSRMLHKEHKEQEIDTFCQLFLGQPRVLLFHILGLSHGEETNREIGHSEKNVKSWQNCSGHLFNIPCQSHFCCLILQIIDQKNYLPHFLENDRIVTFGSPFPFRIPIFFSLIRFSSQVADLVK